MDAVPAPRGRLRLADLDFDIQKATLSGWMADPYWVATYGDRWDRVALRWSLDVATIARDLDEETWAPRFDVEIEASPSCWPDLDGLEQAWTEPHGNVYVFGHEPLRESRLSIGPREGTRFALRWAGHCDVGWNQRYGSDLPFEIEAWATFSGIAVRGSMRDTDADFDARLAAAIDLAGLTRQPTERDGPRYESGVTMATARWSPR